MLERVFAMSKLDKMNESPSYDNFNCSRKFILPLMKDNDELGLAPVFGEIKGSKEDEEF